MEFASDLGKLQRQMASSSAGISRRQAILETLSISAGDQIMDVGCGGGHLLEHLAKAVGEKGHVYGLILAKTKLLRLVVNVQTLKT